MEFPIANPQALTTKKAFIQSKLTYQSQKLSGLVTAQRKADQIQTLTHKLHQATNRGTRTRQDSGIADTASHCLDMSLISWLTRPEFQLVDNDRINRVALNNKECKVA